MKWKNSNGGFFDFGGTIYSFFLHFMLIGQVVLLVKDAYYSELISCGIHILGMLYFTLRIHIFCKIMYKANSSGYSIVDYLREKYGS